MSGDEGLSAKANGGADIYKLLNWMEETDIRLVLHVEWVVHVKQCMGAAILSNGTDTFALLLLNDVAYLQNAGGEGQLQQFRLLGMSRKVIIEQWICWKHIMSTFLLDIHISVFGNIHDLLCLSHFIR